MQSEREEFVDHVAPILRRFYEQNGQPVCDEGSAREIAFRLWELVIERGLPRPLAPHERGEPGGMSDEQCAPLVARVLAGETDPLSAEAVRQLIKTCFYPEFKVCRDSFRAVSADGMCRRQELSRVRRRVSGTHCVDCPHWVALPPDQHFNHVAMNWRAGADELREHRDVYLPDDFRQLRRWLYIAARRPRA